jgi:molybdenum cofactor biosynthesis protein B
MSSVEHKKHTPQHLRFALLTVSTSRHERAPQAGNPDEAGDGSGRLMMELVEHHGHSVESYQLVPDEKDKITRAVEQAGRVDVILISGGSGISPQDVTIEAVASLFAKEIPGFGEFFRSLSREEIGLAAMLSRATAGVLEDGTVVFCLPGSPGGVRLALEKLILPEIGHLVKHARGG